MAGEWSWFVFFVIHLVNFVISIVQEWIRACTLGKLCYSINLRIEERMAYESFYEFVNELPIEEDVAEGCALCGGGGC